MHLEHRGAVGADPGAGGRRRHSGADPATPSSSRKAAEIGFQLPEPGHYAIGALFMPKKETAWRKVMQEERHRRIEEESLLLLG